MLREVFRSEPLTPAAAGDELPYGFFGVVVSYNAAITGDYSIVVHATAVTKTWPYVDLTGWRFHSVTGKLIKVFGGLWFGSNGVTHPLSLRHAHVSRKGQYWGQDWANGRMWPYKYGNIVTVLPGDVIDKKAEEPFWIVDDSRMVDYRHFTPQPYLWGTTLAIDEKIADGGRFISTGGGRDVGSVYSLVVFNWTSGKWMYDIPLSHQPVQICLEDADHVYVLMQNRVLVLVNYVDGRMLGAAKIPPLHGGNPYGGDSGLDVIFDELRMGWDSIHRRILIVEKPKAGELTYVRGFQMVPEPVRVTTPIPLRVPRQGRTIPVLAQVVDDMNQGVGAYAVDAVVTGDGSLVGLPVTDYHGNALIQVAVNKPKEDSYGS